MDTGESQSVRRRAHVYLTLFPIAPNISTLIVFSRVQHRLSGPGAERFLETITPTSTASLPTNHSTLSCLLHSATGGIVDDTVITRLGPELFYVVTNAACKAKDVAYLSQHIQDRDTSRGALDWEVLDNWGLVALQGPPERRNTTACPRNCRSPRWRS